MSERWDSICRILLKIVSGAILLILFMPEAANGFDWLGAALALHYFVLTTKGEKNNE